MDRIKEIIWDFEWCAKKNNCTTSELKDVIRRLNNLISYSEQYNKPLSDFLEDADEPSVRKAKILKAVDEIVAELKNDRSVIEYVQKLKIKWAELDKNQEN